MARKSEPNAQNSELNPKAHPSGARIEKMMRDVAESNMKPDQGCGDETLRPSERATRYVSPEDPAEGGRDEYPFTDSSTETPHRMDPDDRVDR